MMREHLLALNGHLSGLFDFEPAMRGPAEYEFASVGVFVTRGDRGLFRRLLLAYGYSGSDLGPDFCRRILGHALLHRYSRLRWYLERVPPPPGTSTLEELALAWFGT